MPHSYRITVEPIPAPESEAAPSGPVTFEVTNHDEILGLIPRIEAKAFLPREEAAEFLVGVKLFSEVLLRHRRDPLFAPLLPHVAAFMKAMKASPLRADAPGDCAPDA
ncbi:DUF3861 domain-containing protein [Novosphingobium mangrovi (ex Hu et al. 2023)]|uniref:DUF3861 domain-containing protein n=1 Tax=Novosphingobium mangrovi (ex Hu et al. 2023) TaxID=2930094 RepID=A0ABT0ABA2_9SPHN|nr:DUF3861 domain-containing protein [Novosphingobium mangrovi (ex Hu et al. 2023)]MCJ1960474.1 DUF3861 domain-containing protein [Novosphingobium mangrovi (ex Hu et al. 2023)]